METYRLNVAGLTRELPFGKLESGGYIASFVMLGDVPLVEACARELAKIAPAHDVMITAEAKGIPLVHAMARHSGQDRYIVARKSVKVYMKDVFGIELRSITTERPQKLYIDGDDVHLMRGKRVLIVDDVISTGASMRAVEELVLRAGGIVAGRVAALAEGKAARREDIAFLAPLPIFDENRHEVSSCGHEVPSCKQEVSS